MERWFSSDLHLWHENIIGYSNRPFENATVMSEFLLDMHNQLVKPQDHWSCLGDLTILRGGRVQREQFIKMIKRFNGHKRLYMGNHDHFDAKVYVEAGFEKIYGTWRTQENIIFSHIPLHSSCLGNSVIANVHGHTHEQPNLPAVIREHPDGNKTVIPYINICVEKTYYAPITIEDVKQRIKDGKSVAVCEARSN